MRYNLGYQFASCMQNVSLICTHDYELPPRHLARLKPLASAAPQHAGRQAGGAHCTYELWHGASGLLARTSTRLARGQTWPRAIYRGPNSLAPKASAPAGRPGGPGPCRKQAMSCTAHMYTTARLEASPHGKAANGQIGPALAGGYR